jgi:hypothetical protein
MPGGTHGPRQLENRVMERMVAKSTERWKQSSASKAGALRRFSVELYHKPFKPIQVTPPPYALVPPSSLPHSHHRPQRQTPRTQQTPERTLTDSAHPLHPPRRPHRLHNPHRDPLLITPCTLTRRVMRSKQGLVGALLCASRRMPAIIPYHKATYRSWPLVK